MAFRRRRFTRRRGARVDMQTFRECGRQLVVDFTQGTFPCSSPLIFADLVLAVGDTASGVLQKAGANRTVSFAGAHGQLEYSAQVCPGSDQMPANAIFRVYSALMVLPLAENSSVAPAVLPNIAASRSQLSVIFATQSDSERRILWYRLDRLHWTNMDATQDPGFCDFSDNLVDTRYRMIVSNAMAFYGRTWPSASQFRVKARARMTEREGLFLVRNIVCDPFGSPFGINAVFGLSSDAYLRFAVK